MNKILNTYLYSNISFMHSKVKYGFILQQYKNKKIIQTQLDFSTPNQPMSERSIQNCLNKFVHEHTGNKSKGLQKHNSWQLRSHRVSIWPCDAINKLEHLHIPKLET